MGDMRFGKGKVGQIRLLLNKVGMPYDVYINYNLFLNRDSRRFPIEQAKHLIFYKRSIPGDNVAFFDRSRPPLFILSRLGF